MSTLTPGRLALLGAALSLSFAFAQTTDKWQPWSDLKDPAPVADSRTGVLADWEALECMDCHATIGLEWAESRHALAWKNEPYQDDLSTMRRPQGCWGCHVPELLHLGKLEKKPKPRAEDRHQGITCRSCHEGEGGTILGPLGHPTDAHESKQAETFQPGNNSLCITCHNQNIGPVIGIARGFAKTDQAATGKSCVGCHMAPVERPMATDPEGKEIYPKRKGRSHRLQTPRDPSFLRRAFKLRVDHSETAVTVTLINRCGHRVPGLAERKLVFEGRVLDADGKLLASGELTIDRQAYLPIDGNQKLELTLEGGGPGARVEVRGMHHAPTLEEPVEFLYEVIEY